MNFLIADSSSILDTNRIRVIKSVSTSNFVKPLDIEQKLFQKPRKNQRQEGLRQLILESFVELNRRPEVFGRPFTIISPSKTWNGGKKVCELKEISNSIGDHMANWIEQALDWAYQISKSKRNWEKLSNCPDESECFRLIDWKDGCARLMGGSSYTQQTHTMTDIFSVSYGLEEEIYDTVPAVVRYEN